MGRGGFRRGRPHASVESCHALSSWGDFTYAQTGEEDSQFKIEWVFGEDVAVVKFRRDQHQWVEYIPLTWQPCRYGGRRAWFHCPRCGRRVGKVHLPTVIFYPDQTRVNRFGCRFCLSLAYERQQHRNPYWTWVHRAERFADRWLIESRDGEDFIRPKGMHFRTFHRNMEAYNALMERAGAYAFCSLATNVPDPATGENADVAMGNAGPSELMGDAFRQFNANAAEAMRAWVDQQTIDRLVPIPDACD